MPGFLYQLIEESTTDNLRTEVFETSTCVHSAWGPDLQHGGPVAALMTRSMESHVPRAKTRISRIRTDILGAIPLTKVRVSTRIVRPGRRIELLGSTFETLSPNGTWRPAAVASAWRLSTQDTSDVARNAEKHIGTPPKPSQALNVFERPASWYPGGFADAVTIHVQDEGTHPGERTRVWINMHYRLVEHEPISPLAQLVAVSDIANGMGARLDPVDFSFLNTDLDVHLFRPPEGPWFGIEAESSIGPDGIGLSNAVLHGNSGPIGTVSQNLLVERAVRN